jgi:hypothetical protein
MDDFDNAMSSWAVEHGDYSFKIACIKIPYAAAEIT